ncbi:hypothetical protein CfE428DRAFT_5580 [Chthoniobacter flavus Ellin428]|uniref:Uncharacterized protein n=1 Tax=Chthoniobacter flavus Ellin428 TaxID=497964 RepID=B4D9J0_9BACT|nr:hypothetical protein [Chthoniobacter flavus]EDY16951.1 hypothetical protein CfE428DRAFT_5580 [Chthoniobacter flavus Ellin428]TCO87829.1 hypothetical protein EV701_120128 [Chthoniobacter flavus]
MNEKSENRPYHELSEFDTKLRPLLSDGWEYPRPVSHYAFRDKSCPLPVGPGTFPLDFSVYDTIKAIEVKYEFVTGREAEIQAAEEGAPEYKISAPEGHVIIPVGNVRQWMIHLPAGTQVHAYIDKWQKDLEKIARLPKWEMTPEDLEEGRRALEEARKRREEG